MIDCFLFHNELDLLEIRLNTLAPYVERFILCECPITHSGKKKLLYYAENKDRFKEFPITHLIVDDYQMYGAPPVDEGIVAICQYAQRIENHQRDFLFNGIKDEDPDTIILLCDIDEIPDLTPYKRDTEGSFMQYVYCYYLNIYTGKRNGKGPITIKQKNIYGEYEGLNDVRNSKWRIPKIRTHSGGWCHGFHFTCLGSIEQALYKIDSCYHQNFNVPEIIDSFEENRRRLIDPYMRGKYQQQFMVKMPYELKWLMDNYKKYEYLFYKGETDGC
ncbi:MAG: hypothetical protein ABIE03_01045 [Patescibacteria group bacterium]